MWYEVFLDWTFYLNLYIIFILVYFLLRIMFINKRIFEMSIIFGLVVIIYGICNALNLPFTKELFFYIMLLLPLVIVILNVAEIKLSLETLWKFGKRKEMISMGGDKTKNEIIKAVLELSKKSLGALITIEKLNTLEQYSSKAIAMDSDISKELLLNIFTPGTPLHDGAVIIRGNKIVCAGAYYVLSNNDNFDKTTGSRHRAGLGISEISDSLTIVVSEETGKISVAIEGIMLPMNEESRLTEYLNMFMK